MSSSSQRSKGFIALKILQPWLCLLKSGGKHKEKKEHETVSQGPFQTNSGTVEQFTKGGWGTFGNC